MKNTEINSCSTPESNTSHSFSADPNRAPPAQTGHCYCPPGQEQGYGCAKVPLVNITKCDSNQAQQGLTGSVIPQINAETGEVIIYRLVGEGVYREQKERSDTQLEKRGIQYRDDRKDREPQQLGFSFLGGPIL